MSALGQKRKSQLVVTRSALPPKTDIGSDIVRVGLCQGPPLCCGFFFQKLSRRPNSPMVALVEMRWPVAQYPCQRFDRIKIQFLPYRVSEDAYSLDFGFYQIARQTIACGRNEPMLGLPASSELSIRRPSGTSRCPSDDDHPRL